MSWLADITCAMFGHDMDIDGNKDGSTTVRCDRCGGGRRYVWVIEEGFYEKHGFPVPEPEQED